MTLNLQSTSDVEGFSRSAGHGHEINGQRVKYTKKLQAGVQEAGNMEKCADDEFVSDYDDAAVTLMKSSKKCQVPGSPATEITFVAWR